MSRAVLDSTVLVSAFLKPHESGPSFELLNRAAAGNYELWLSPAILEETEQVLRTATRIRRRYAYADSDVTLYREQLAKLGRIVTTLPVVRVVRDATDDPILATALASRADYLVTRDKDLLSLHAFRNIEMLTPEQFLALLRSAA